MGFIMWIVTNLTTFQWVLDCRFFTITEQIIYKLILEKHLSAMLPNVTLWPTW